MIVTPRKLKIDLPLGYAFALIARVYPKVDAFQFLKRVEGIQKIHSLAGFVTGVICFALNLNPWAIAGGTFGVTMVFFLLRFFGIFFIPGLLWFSTYYSYATGFGLFTLGLIGLGFWCVGIWGVLAYFIARIVAEGVTWLLDSYAGKQLGVQMGTDPALAKMGSMFLAPAKDFVNTYRLFADKFGLMRDVEVSEEELHFANWKHVWEDFEDKWPEISARYDENPYDWI